VLQFAAISTSWNVIAKRKGPEGPAGGTHAQRRGLRLRHTGVQEVRGAPIEKADEGDPVPEAPVPESLEHGRAINGVERVLYVRERTPHSGFAARNASTRGTPRSPRQLTPTPDSRGQRLLHAMAESMGEEASGQAVENLSHGRRPHPAPGRRP